jgi:hypothetical protein
VRALRLDEEKDQKVSSLLQTIQRLRRSAPLLPNLHTLGWNGLTSNFADSIMFMHDGVKECHLCYTQEDEILPNIVVLTKAIQTYMSGLTFVDMDLFPSQEFVGPLSTLLGNLPQLTRVILPPFKDISDILSTLRRSTILEILEFRYFYSDTENLAVTETGSPIQEDCYTALDELFICLINYSAILSFLHGHILSNLRICAFHTLSFEKPDAIRNLCQVISSFAPNLEGLKLTFDETVDDPGLNPPIEEIVTFNDLRSVLACTKMTFFEFGHLYPVDISDSDVEEIASAWKRLDHIDISSSPLCSVLTIRKPTLQAVYMLTCRCPRLKYVGLLLDTTATSLQISDVDVPNPPAKLTTLDVGDSLIESEDVYKFAMSMARFCTSNCQLDWSTSIESVQGRWRMVEDAFYKK